jgi:rhamnogalacturonan acetylesterase
MVIPRLCPLCDNNVSMHSSLKPVRLINSVLLALLVSAACASRAAGPIFPQSSANLDASRDTASKSGFLTDTNRTLPILFIVGDSTVHNPGKGERGWGDVISKYFDAKKIRVENHALGGRTTRTFITQGWWDKVITNSKPGDFVLIQLGHNDGGPLDDTNRARGSIRGLGEETKDIYNPITKKPETVHTYGWYLRQYIADARARGMTPILCTPIPHCPKDKVQAGDVEKSDYVKFSTAVAESEKVPFVNLNKITMGHYVGLSPEEIKEKYFTPADGTHTSPAGAELNAQSVIEGLRQLKACPVVNFLLPAPSG